MMRIYSKGCLMEALIKFLGDGLCRTHGNLGAEGVNCTLLPRLAALTTEAVNYIGIKERPCQKSGNVLYIPAYNPAVGKLKARVSSVKIERYVLGIGIYICQEIIAGNAVAAC